MATIHQRRIGTGESIEQRLVHDLTDGRYYVFDKLNDKPFDYRQLSMGSISQAEAEEIFDCQHYQDCGK